MTISNSVVNVGQQDVQTQGNPAAPARVERGAPRGMSPRPAPTARPGAGLELPPFEPIGAGAGAAPSPPPINLPPIGMQSPPGEIAPDLGPPDLAPPPAAAPGGGGGSPFGPTWNRDQGTYV